MMNQQYHPVTTVLLRTLFNALFLGSAGLLFLNLRITPVLLMLAALPAVLLVVSFIVYLHVLQRKHASQINPFSQSLDTLFIFLASIILLHEPATLPNYAGILVTVIGIYLVLTEHITRRPRLDRNLLIIAALVPIDIAYALLVKYFRERRADSLGSLHLPDGIPHAHRCLPAHATKNTTNNNLPQTTTTNRTCRIPLCRDRCRVPVHCAFHGKRLQSLPDGRCKFGGGLSARDLVPPRKVPQTPVHRDSHRGPRHLPHLTVIQYMVTQARLLH